MAMHPNCVEPCPICDAFRLAFESWATSAGIDADWNDVNEVGEYENPWAQVAWIAYQAGAHNALEEQSK